MEILLESAVRGTLLAAAVAVLLAALRIRSPRIAHRAWTGVALTLLLLPVFVAWGPEASIPVPPSAATARLLDASVAAPPDLPRVVASVPAPRADESNATDWNTIVLLIYGLGTAILLGRLFCGVRHARALVRRAVVVDGRLTNRRCATPVTVGTLTPVVVLPEGWQRWPAAELAAVLAHEEEHVHQRDPLAAFVLLLARAIFWFHPLAWWLQRRVAALSEQACDAAVLARGHDADTYAASLLKFARLQRAAAGRIALTVTGMPGTSLARRLRLLDEPMAARASATRRLAAGVVYAALALLCLTAVPRAIVAAGPPPQVTDSAARQWQVASSEHFEIYYERELANRVRDLTWEAEQAYVHLTNALKYDLRDRVPVIFVRGTGNLSPDAERSLADVATGGRATTAQRIVIAAEYLDTRPGSMVHELTHQFAFEILPETSRQAPWLIEGLADHQRGIWETDSVRRVGEAVASGWVPAIDDLAGADRYWSHALFDFIVDAHGGEGLRRYLFVLSKGSPAAEAIPSAFGGSIADFSQAFRSYVVKRFGQ